MLLRRQLTHAGLIGACLASVALCAVPARAETKPKLAVFDFQLANLAQLPPTKADNDQLPSISDLLRSN